MFVYIKCEKRRVVYQGRSICNKIKFEIDGHTTPLRSFILITFQISTGLMFLLMAEVLLHYNFNDHLSVHLRERYLCHGIRYVIADRETKVCRHVFGLLQFLKGDLKDAKLNFSRSSNFWKISFFDRNAFFRQNTLVAALKFCLKRLP